MEFFRAGDRLHRTGDINHVDLSLLEKQGRVVVVLTDGTQRTLSTADSYDLILLLKPSALEGRRLRWLRHRWAIHNLIGHPAMQLLAFFGYGRLGVKLHDATIPAPIKEHS